MQPPQDLKGRPTVGGPNSPTQGISGLLEKIFIPIVSCLKTYVKDDWDFIRKLPSHVDYPCVIASCDVVSLFTSIPHDLRLETLSYWIDKKRNLMPEILDHALSCKKGGFISLRHNQIRDLTANLLKTICHDVLIEPTLQQLTGESLHERTANITDDVRLDIAVRGFWISGQRAFFDIRVFNPMARRYESQELNKAYEINERENKRHYNERILEVEHGSFTPLVMRALGGIGGEASKFYPRLSESIAEKRKERYSVIKNWISRKISFALVNCVCMCVRGSRSIYPLREIDLENDPRTSEIQVHIS